MVHDQSGDSKFSSILVSGVQVVPVNCMKMALMDVGVVMKGLLVIGLVFSSKVELFYLKIKWMSLK